MFQIYIPKKKNQKQFHTFIDFSKYILFYGIQRNWEYAFWIEPNWDLQKIYSRYVNWY